MNILTIDVGNTNISFAVFSIIRYKKDNSDCRPQIGRLIKKFYIPTQRYNMGNLKKLLAHQTFEKIIICSVVPKVLQKLKIDLKKLLSRSPHCLGEDIKVPIRNLYQKPRQVGQDRLVNAFAAAEIYGLPAIIVDFGTAITFDAVSKNNEYLGGAILPGIEISLDALARRTALLPRVKLKKPSQLIGRDTKNSILSGVVYGYAILVDAFVKRIKKELAGPRVKVIATGGDIDMIGPMLSQIKIEDTNLTHKGLALISQI